MSNHITRSPALAFMDATDAALPKSLTWREQVKALEDALTLAVKNRFQFHKDDAVELQRYSINRCSGKFDPLSQYFYMVSCYSGGTYAAMWEKHRDQAPWFAPLAAHGVLEYAFHARTRFSPNMAILVAPQPGAPQSPDLCSYRKLEVWWCTSMKSDQVVLCRYAMPAPTESRVQSNQERSFHSMGSPAKRKILTRTEFEAFLQPTIDMTGMFSAGDLESWLKSGFGISELHEGFCLSV